MDSKPELSSEEVSEVRKRYLRLRVAAHYVADDALDDLADDMLRRYRCLDWEAWSEGSIFLPEVVPAEKEAVIKVIEDVMVDLQEGLVFNRLAALREALKRDLSS